MTWEMALKEEGEEKWQAGAQHKAIETAGNLLGIGLLSLEQIAQATALPIEQVERLRQEVFAVKA